MLLQFWKNSIVDYQRVTDDEILLDFQNNFPSLDFIARKSRLQKSKCKKNGPYYYKVKKQSPLLLNSLFTPSRLPRLAGESNPRGGRE